MYMALLKIKEKIPFVIFAPSSLENDLSFRFKSVSDPSHLQESIYLSYSESYSITKESLKVID